METETTQILVLLSQICLRFMVFLLSTLYPEMWQLFSWCHHNRNYNAHSYSAP